MMKNNSSGSRRGFTLLEILLVVAAIGILAGIVIVAINPGQQLADTRDAQRKVDTRTIATAINQYRLRTGNLPTSLSVANDNGDCEDDQYEICKTGASCAGPVDLSVLTNNNEYIPSIPRDPNGSSVNGTGYHAATDSTGTRVIVCAPNEESVTESIIVVQ